MIPITTPLVSFDQEQLVDLDFQMRREWLVTNGIGGYASATVAGPLSRSYHGLLVAALEPPVARTVLLAGMVEWVTVGGERFPTSTHEFSGGTIAPEGYQNLMSFRLEGTMPVWRYQTGSATVERRIWMEYGRNQTLIRYSLVESDKSVELELTPLITCRSFHALARGSMPLSVRPAERSVSIHFDQQDAELFLKADQAAFKRDEAWWWNFHHREETARGLADTGDHFAPGTFSAVLQPGESVTLIASDQAIDVVDSDTSLRSFAARERALLDIADAAEADQVVQQLVLAADQFIVSRPLPGIADGKSVIAGYHWFNDWGRDTMIALPGLCLSTGRVEEAESILRTFARYVDQGMLPNNFPDAGGEIPGYNTVDATLWYLLAIDACYRATGDNRLIADLLPVMQSIVEFHIAGTRYQIKVDPTDGLLYAGEAGVQLTWMDARVGDWVVTPRIGKPVEIQTLWYNALLVVAQHLAVSDSVTAERFEAMASLVKRSFQSRFFRSDLSHLADVIDGPEGDDWTLRPNQIFAISLPHSLVDGEMAQLVLESVSKQLKTGYGLRSLDPASPSYQGHYGGDQWHRDSAYHQGPVWNWLLGPFAEACFKVTGNQQAAFETLEPIARNLSDAGLGSLSEIMEGDSPHEPRGCIAQAWSVGETLRVWRLLQP